MRGRKCQSSDNYIMRSFMVCTAHQILPETMVSWTKHVEGKAIPVQAYYKHRVFQELEAH
jgi:hypothetical protein